MNVLAIGAHPDDIDIYAGGTMLRYVERGDTVKFCVVTSGDIGHYKYSREELSAIRREEQLESAKIAGVETKFIGLPERIVDDNPTRDAIINVIRWANPDVVFTHWPDDSSVDHHIIGNIVKQALLCLKWKNQQTEYPPIDKLPKVFFWEPNGGFNYQPEQYVDISAQMEKKRSMLACHKSQVELEQDYMHCIEAMGMYRGLQAGCAYAEGFKAHLSFENPPDYRLLP